MREIKFRTWVKNESKMITGHLATAIDVFTQSFAYRSNEVELMQYTGLKDKNDKEIYEGDILIGVKDYRNRNLVIKWDDDECYYKLNMSDYFNVKKLTKNNVKSATVIGNIYENPELL